jgi:hypothetical protein
VRNRICRNQGTALTRLGYWSTKRRVRTNQLMQDSQAVHS